MKYKIALAALCMLTLPASADTLPGMRGVDHIGMTVPDLAQAESFFADVLGCKTATSFGPFSDDKGTFMHDLLNVDPKSVIIKITLMRCGFGSNLELFNYTAPDQKTVLPKNSDIGGHHIAIYVDDINAAAKYFKEKGVKTLLGPLPIKEGPVAGQSILYFFAPWGLQMEAITYPNGEAYAKNGGTILWDPRDPAK